MKRAQSAIEFVMLIAVVFGIFVIFFMVLTSRLAELANEKDRELLQDFSLFVENELKLAAAVEDGYVRYLEVPPKIYDQEVNVSLQISTSPAAVLLVVNYTFIQPDYYIVSVMPSTIVTGLNRRGERCDVQEGFNCISKQQGVVYVNAFGRCGDHQCLCNDVEVRVGC
jgi:hypothetical protein